ncbi:unnamed protein product, partial [Discosporangium mesarthrocarpum]
PPLPLCSLIFNAFVFCQLFNEFNARSLTDEWNAVKIFLWPSLGESSLEPKYDGMFFFFFIVDFGGDFTKTTGLNSTEWIITAALGAIALPLGVLMRFIPVKVRRAPRSSP